MASVWSRRRNYLTVFGVAITTGLLPEQDEELGELAALAFARRYPSRVKCATLPWHVLKHALKGNTESVTTE